MKVLFFSTYFYPYISGLTIYPWRILNNLSKKHKITVLTFSHGGSTSEVAKGLLGGEGQLTIKYLSYLFRLSKGFISPQSIIYFLKEVKKNDLVILNLPNFEGLVLALIAWLYKKKIISIYLCQVELGHDIFSRTANFFLNFSVFVQYLLSNIIVGETDYINNTYINKVFKSKIRTTLPPIEILPISTQFINELKHEKKNDIWIGFAGRIAREKGIEYLIEALIPEIKLVFAGPTDTVGESSYLKEVKNLLKVNNINHLFLGQLTSEELGAFYKTIDILVLPSVNQTEAFGMVQVEAMLLGTPVIATNLSGIRVPIKLTKMGRLVKPKDSQEFKKAVEIILKNKNKYTNDALIKNAQKIFDIDKVYKFYEQLINEKN